MLASLFPKPVRVPVTLVGESGVRTLAVRYVDRDFVENHPNTVDITNLDAPAIINYRPHVPTTEGKSVRTFDPFSLLFMACATPCTHTVRQIMSRWNLPTRQAHYVWKAVQEFRNLPGFALAYFKTLASHGENSTLAAFSETVRHSLQVR